MDGEWAAASLAEPLVTLAVILSIEIELVGREESSMAFPSNVSGTQMGLPMRGKRRSKR
jgi:hypothetical protein